MQVNTKFSHLIIICIYGPPSGNFDQFLALLDSTLKHLYMPRTEVLICGDINVHYVMHSHRKKQLSSSMTTYNPSHSVYFPPGIQNCTLIDNSYNDTNRLHVFSVISIVTVLSHGNGQYLILKNVFAMSKTRSSTRRTRLLCKDSISDFLELLKMKFGVICMNLIICKIHLTHF